MSLAPAAYTLFQRVLLHDSADAEWIGRDRFVLSCGHASMLLYCQLYLSGYGLTLDDIKDLRQWGSLTPAHPEYGHTRGVEMTTGPLGQGLATAVGMAMGQRRLHGILDPETPLGASVFDSTIWVFASDGDIEEGVTSEASSLAGHQRLGNLVVLYDSNTISIEGHTDLASSENVAARYEAYGWHVAHVDSGEDLDALQAAMLEARAVSDRPSLIIVKSVIAWPAPKAQNTAKSHGSALGAEEVAATKRAMGMDPDKSFDVPDDVLNHARQVIGRGVEAHEAWQTRYDVWADANPEGARLLARMSGNGLPEDLDAALPTFEAGSKVATRVASGKVLAAVGPLLPELFGGSADLAGSNNTTIPGEESFLPPGNPEGGSPYGRTVHFGIREHAMGAALNGMALMGLRPYAGTFLVFSDYMRPAVRIAAIMQLPVVYVWTHDSIGLGEDGPTHQPVEHLWALRAIPGLDVVRPADATETAVAWKTTLHRTSGPTALCLSRQDLPVIDRASFASAEGVARGGYVLAEATSGSPDVIIIATGSEVSIALEARVELESGGIGTRVVSMPCVEWFEAQTSEYRDQVLLPTVTARVSVEAGLRLGWREFVGDRGVSVSLEHFGASAPYQTLYSEFGITTAAVVRAARETLEAL